MRSSPSLAMTFGRGGREIAAATLRQLLPAISEAATKEIREEIRRWKLPRRSDKSIEDLARMFNPKIRGWVQ